MFRFKRSSVLLAAAFIASGTLGSSQAANAVDPTPNSTDAAELNSSTTTQVVEIPLVAVPHHSAKSGVAPDTVVPLNCGTAFLFISNGHDHVHYDFGFWDLKNATFWVNGTIGTINDDNGRTDADNYGGAYFGSSWEKQGNLYTGTGTNEVSAYIYAFGPIYDCESSPTLTDAVYVY